MLSHVPDKEVPNIRDSVVVPTVVPASFLIAAVTLATPEMPSVTVFVIVMLALAMSGVTVEDVMVGATVSTVMDTAVDGPDVFPAASVAVAVKV